MSGRRTYQSPVASRQLSVVRCGDWVANRVLSASGCFILENIKEHLEHAHWARTGQRYQSLVPMIMLQRAGRNSRQKIPQGWETKVTQYSQIGNPIITAAATVHARRSWDAR